MPHGFVVGFLRVARSVQLWMTQASTVSTAPETEEAAVGFAPLDVDFEPGNGPPCEAPASASSVSAGGHTPPWKRRIATAAAVVGMMSGYVSLPIEEGRKPNFKGLARPPAVAAAPKTKPPEMPISKPVGPQQGVRLQPFATQQELITQLFLQEPTQAAAAPGLNPFRFQPESASLTALYVTSAGEEAGEPATAQELRPTVAMVSRDGLSRRLPIRRRARSEQNKEPPATEYRPLQREEHNVHPRGSQPKRGSRSKTARPRTPGKPPRVSRVPSSPKTTRSPATRPEVEGRTLDSNLLIEAGVTRPLDLRARLPIPQAPATTEQRPTLPLVPTVQNGKIVQCARVEEELKPGTIRLQRDLIEPTVPPYDADQDLENQVTSGGSLEFVLDARMRPTGAFRVKLGVAGQQAEVIRWDRSGVSHGWVRSARSLIQRFQKSASLDCSDY